MEGTKEHIATVQAIAEDKYFEEAQGLYIDSFSQDFKTVSPYRGQNANMHMCEAQIALFEALGQIWYLERATGIAHRLVVELPTKAGKSKLYNFRHIQLQSNCFNYIHIFYYLKAGCYGCIVEHYTSEWHPDPDKNRDTNPSSEEYIFRPFGFQPGHSFEWAKLLLLIESHHKKLDTKEKEIAWVLPAAELLFETACAYGWDKERGGAFYTFDSNGKVLDTNKYYWALVEMIAAAGLLGQRTGKAVYWEWYDKAWEFALKYFIDEERGGWYPMLNAENMRTDAHAGPNHIGPMVKCYPSKTDYHPLAACYEVLHAMGEAAP